MNPTPVTKYRCPTCFELHSSERRAENCCEPEIEDVDLWACSECGITYDDREQAHLCCWDGESDLEPLMPTPQDLEAAGQQRLGI